MKRTTKIFVLFGLIGALLLFLFLIDLFIGSVSISFSEIISILMGNTSSVELKSIVIGYRLPKALTAVVVGAALSVSGLQMQTIFRNPLAGPYVLGISAGASLGVAVLVMGFSSFFTVGLLSPLGNWSIVIMAWLGSALVLFLIMLLSFRINDIMTILILGILFSSATSSIVSILQFFSSETMLKSFVVWTMGSIGGVTPTQLKVLLPSVFLGLVLSMLTIKQLDVMHLGENYSKSMGVNVTKTRILVFISTSILAGTVTAFCGPIGFIGIAVPHIARMIFQTSLHKILLPASVLLGASIMLLSDCIAQLPGLEMVLPVNSITALIGIPIIIWIIFRNKKIGGFY